MNILFVCHRLPYPPRRGGKIRPFNIIKHFTERGHEVTVASLARSATELEEGRGLRDYCADSIIEPVSPSAAMLRMVARLPSSTPSSMGYFYSPELLRKIRNLVERRSFDLVMVHCSSVAQYVADLAGMPKILDFGDMDSQKWLLYAQHRPFPLAAGYWLEGNKLLRAEKELARKFDLCTCTTRAELETLRSFGAATRSDWFPNGVDTDYFSPADEPYDTESVSFVGRMDYFPNQQAVFWFCSQVWPLVRARRPRAQLSIVGAAPSRAIQSLDGNDGVVVTGTVKDVRPFVRKTAMTIAPLAIARGTQNKILESMAMGVPVVASSAAVGGVYAEPGKHIAAADSAQEWATAVLRLLEDPGERRRLAEAGRAQVLTHHSWAGSMTRLDSLVDACLRAQPVAGTEAANA